MPITSPTNPRLKEIRKLARASVRASTGRFVAEGEDLNEAAFAAGAVALGVACAPGLGRGRDGWYEVDAGVLAGASTLASGARVIGVYEQRWSAPSGPLALALWGVRDPGNVGTIIRCAHAFGVACVALGPDCADPFGPRAVRASMGAIFAVALARFERLDQLPGDVIALDAGGHTPFRGPLAGEATLLLGAEREGLPDELIDGAARVCSIAQAAGDSLNVAMAATIACYEATRMAGG